MYIDSKTVVRTVHGYSDCFEVICMHQGIAFSPSVFVIIMVISREFRDTLQWELLYADDCWVVDD